MLMDDLNTKTVSDYTEVVDLNSKVVVSDKNNKFLQMIVGGPDNKPGVGLFEIGDSVTYTENYFLFSGDHRLSALSSDASKVFVSNDYDYSLTVYNAIDMTVLAENTSRTNPLRGVNFAMNDQYIVGFDAGSSTVKIFNTSDLTEEFEFSSSDSPDDCIMGVYNDNAKLFAVVDWNYKLYMYDIENRKLVYTKETDYTGYTFMAQSVNFNEDGSKLVSLGGPSSDNHWIIDPSDGTILNSFTNNGTSNEYFGEEPCAHFHPNNNYVVITSSTGGGDNALRIVNIETDTLLKEITDTGSDDADLNNMSFVGFSDEGDKIYYFSESDSLHHTAEVMPTVGTLHLVDENNVAINDDTDYITNTKDIGTVYQTVPSDIFEIAIRNDTGLTLSSIDVSSPEALMFGTSDTEFEGLESLTLDNGPYNDGDLITIYCRVKVGTDKQLGNDSMSVVLQGNE